MTAMQRRQFFWVSLAAIGVAGCRRDDADARVDEAAEAPASADGGAASTGAAAASRPRVVALGDSLTAGLGLPPEQAWPALVQRRIDEAGLDVEVVNAGVSGDTTAGGVRRLDWALDGDVRVLILELGANDMLRGLDPALTRANLDAILGELKRRNIKVLIAGMRAAPNLDPAYVARFEAIYPELAKRNGAALYPFFMEGVAGQKGMTQPDGMHPTFEGVKRIVTGITPAVKQALGR